MKIRRTSKAPRVRLSDACHTSQADMERIINNAPVPAGAPRWQARTGRQGRSGRR